MCQGSHDEVWINQQINRRRHAGESVCVRVRVQTGSLNALLSTPTCGGGGRPPTAEEQRLFDIWAKHRLNGQDFTGGDLVAFLPQVKGIC